MKKTLFKALLPTMAMILVAIMALTGTTYAWFTSTKTATVEKIDIKVTTASSMKIAVVDKANTTTSGWTNNLELTDISNSKNATWTADLQNFLAVSSVTGKAGTFYTAEVDPTDSTKIKNGAANSSAYLKFEAYLWNDSDSNKTVNLGGSVVSSSSNVYKALRISLVNMGEAKASYTSGDPIAEFTGSESGSSIWEPAGSSNTQALNTSFVGPVEKSGGHTNAQSTQANASSVGVSVDAHSVQKVAVYIWLEGQDVDCVNAITGKEVSITLMFDGN